jgi:hypothetical protein
MTRFMSMADSSTIDVLGILWGRKVHENRVILSSATTSDFKYPFL